MAQGLLPRNYSRFDIVIGHYYWLCDHHTGQGSDAYARACRIARSFHPGSACHGPDTQESQEVYNALCQKHGCTHEAPPMIQFSHIVIQFSHIDESDSANGMYAVDTDGHSYEILWLDPENGIDAATGYACGALPITERFPGQAWNIPAAYLEAWTVDL